MNQVARLAQELRVHQVELEQQNEELRQANLELEEARNRYADLFEFAPVGYVVCNEGGLIGQINVTGCAQLGSSCAELTGRHISLFMDAPQRPVFAQVLEQIFRGDAQGGAPHRVELRMIRQSGEPWDVQLEGTLLQGSSGQQARLVLTDVTALKEAQRSIQRHAAQALHLHEELQTFLHSMTHDLSAPQRQVEGFTALLAQHLTAADETTAKLLKNLLQAARNLGALTTSLTDFYRSGQPGEPARPLNVSRLIEVIFHELEPQRQGRQVALTHDPLPTLQVDHQNLHMVFLNLLSNAIKFTGPRPQARIHVGVQVSDEHFLFSVRDNGVGFDPRQERRLFGVFERLHSDRDFPGQGLGLALVRRIVERWKGQVWAESVPGEGAVFWVRLPRALGAEQVGPAEIGRGPSAP